MQAGVPWVFASPVQGLWLQLELFVTIFVSSFPRSWLDSSRHAFRCVFEEKKCDPETLNYKRELEDGREGDARKRKGSLSEIHVVDPEGRLLVVSPSLVGLLGARLATVVEAQLVLFLLGTATDTRVGQLEAGPPLAEHASADHRCTSREREGQAAVRDGRRAGGGAAVEV